MTSDVFTEIVKDFLHRELGTDAVRLRHKEYQEEQSRLRSAFIEFCDRTGYDPDVDAYYEAYPEESLHLDFGDTDTDPSP